MQDRDATAGADRRGQVHCLEQRFAGGGGSRRLRFPALREDVGAAGGDHLAGIQYDDMGRELANQTEIVTQQQDAESPFGKLS
ncbi:hypothetical protein GCM10009745_08910 [Kribbella yunnanensis]|uniref:Uncharacterized protein n=1 Tax=Kribbella yunnanensis TaxID=190194 RepID=A0ABN2GC78_9ACTN